MFKKAKLISMIMAMVMACSLVVGCGGGGGNGGGNGTSNGGKIDNEKTQVILKFFQGTATRDTAWLDTLIKNFTEANKNTEFESGKKGVQVTFSTTRNLPLTTLSSDGADLYMAENDADIYDLSIKGDILDLTSVVTPLESKIDSDAKKRMVGKDGKYYALPSYDFYAGVPYDEDLLIKKNCFFAAPETSDKQTFTSNDCAFIKDGESFYMVANANAKKSCGPDGAYGTPDDGLPSSLQEMLVWCWYMKTKAGINPFVMGNDTNIYSFYLTHAIWASLAGYDAMRAVYTNFAEGGTDAEVVTGFSSENFYVSADGSVKIPMPIVENVKLTKENGYKAYDMSARYYSLAFLQIAYKEGWLVDNQGGNTGAMSQFICDGDSAMLYDASYWYHEAVAKGYFEDWEDEADPDVAAKGRHIKFLTCPSQLSGSVAENGGKKNTLMNLGNSYVFANAHLDKAGNEGKKAASLSFLNYMYTDEGLGIFTGATGLSIPMEYNYTIPSDDISAAYYYNNVKDIKEHSDVVNYASDNQYFKNNLKSFSLSWSSSVTTFTINGTLIGNGYLDAIKKYNGTAQNIFEATKRSADTWATIIG